MTVRCDQCTYVWGVGRSKSPAVSVLLMILLASALYQSQVVQPVRASVTIVIRADGYVYPSSAPIHRVGEVYTFNDDIVGSLEVDRSNIVIDGNGYVLQGSGNETGLSLPAVDNVTIRNLRVTTFRNGVDLHSSSNISVLDSNIIGNDYGFYLYSSSNNNFTGNNVTGNGSNGFGIYQSSNNNVIVGNNVSANSDAGIGFGFSYGNIIRGNDVVGNTNYGVWLDSASSNTVSRNLIANNSFGIYSYYCSNSILGNDVVNNTYGIRLELFSDYNIISGNNVTANADYGVWLVSSSGNSIIENTIAKGNYGVRLDSSSNHNAIFGNNITSNSDGVYLYSSSGNSITRNYIANNYDGIAFYSSSGNIISGNNVTENANCGVFLSSSDNNGLSRNNMTGNRYGVSLSFSSVNAIYHNNFVSNVIQAHSGTLGYSNTWDDGYPSGGNYWSDYGGADANNDGIGDISYLIDDNNIDNYPFLKFYTARSRGDINQDGRVDILDCVIIASAFSSKLGDPNWNPNADINNDGLVDILDLVVVASHFGETS